ncbi:MAG TPA: hypothetical protein VGL61_05625 [Kofleriaceae bacterium]|jgi:hypothetical protein
MKRVVTFAALACACAGCLIPTTPSGNGDDDDGNNQAQMDVDQWNQLVMQDDARRTQVLGNNDGALAPVGNQLFYQDFTNYNPALYRYDHASGTTLAYQFSIGGGDDANERASASFVVTADDSDDPVTFDAYDANAANSLVDSTQLPAPDGAKYDAYAVDGSTVYFIDQSTEGATTLLRWTPGSGAPAAVTTLEQDGVDVGEFEDFDVHGNTMVFIESGRIWSFDLASLTPTWLMNMTQVTGDVDFESDGVTFDTQDGALWFYAYSTNTLTNVSAKIDTHTFPLNQTFGGASQYDADADTSFARWGNDVLYIGEDGVFAYDLVQDQVTAVVLSPDLADLRIDYRAPVALDDGTLFVTGLTSNDGAIGADGPVYEIALPPIFQ